jgi:TolA-binding protein
MAVADEARYAALVQRLDCIDKRTTQLEQRANESNTNAQLYERQELILRRIQDLEGGAQHSTKGVDQNKLSPRAFFDKLNSRACVHHFERVLRLPSSG